MMYKLFLILLSAVFSYASVELNPDNYKEAVQSEKIVIVEFYTGYCSWCTKLQTWVDKNNFKTYKLNAENYREFSKENKVNSYPTVIVYKNGVPVNKVSGIDDAKDIIRYYNLKEIK